MAKPVPLVPSGPSFAYQFSRLDPRVQALLRDRKQFYRALTVFRKQPPAYIQYVQTTNQDRIDDWLAMTKRGLLLKARQIGGTTAIRARAFHRVYALGLPERWATISYKQGSSFEIGRIDRTFLERIDPSTTSWLHGRPRINATEVEFPRTDGRLIAYTAAASGGTGTRSFALTDAHVSELAFYNDPAELLATVEGSVDSGTIIGESTPNAPHDFFHKLCLGALEGTNGWSLCTSWWWQDENYYKDVPDDFEPTSEEIALAQRDDLTLEQLVWRRDKIAVMGIEKFRREYPGCFDDCFFVGEGWCFPPGPLDAIRESWTEGTVDPYDLYAIGADPSGGVGADDASYTVFSQNTGQVVEHLARNDLPPREFAHLLAERGLYWNKARINVEQNNHGHAVLMKLEDLRYTNLLVDADGDYFSTNGKTKREAIAATREFLDARITQSLPLPLLAQLRALRDPGGMKLPCAPPGQKDDRAMSFILGVVCLNSLPGQSHVQAIGIDRATALVSRLRAKKYKSRNTPWVHR